MVEKKKKVQPKGVAGAATEIYAELLRKGIKPKDALALAKQMGTAATSSSDGHCGARGE